VNGAVGTKFRKNVLTTARNFDAWVFHLKQVDAEGERERERERERENKR
jgi:hypothetical protein